MTGRGYLGGGSIAGALGLSPYQTPLDVYCEITGDMQRPVNEDRRAFFDRRKAWEPMARDIFQAKTGAKIVRFNERYTMKTLPWAKAEIDAETEDDANVEFKSLRPELRWMWNDPGEDAMGAEPPPYVTSQAAWGMGVRANHGCWVHALDLDDDLIYWVERDEEVILDIFDRAQRFWTNHIEKRRPPMPVDVNDILRLYGKGTERAVEATSDIAEALRKRDEACKTIKVAEADKLAAEKDIKLYMRDASVLTINGKQVATWKADARSVRTFRTKQL